MYKFIYNSIYCVNINLATLLKVGIAMPKTYMISYNLKSRNRKYFDMLRSIQNLNGTNIHLQDSLWLVKTNETPDTMYQKFHKILNDCDSLFICELVPNYQGLASPADWEFIEKYTFR